MTNKLSEFKEIHEYLIKMTEEIGKIPTIAQLDSEKILPSARQIRKIYEDEVGENYLSHLKGLGYKDGVKRHNVEFTYEMICEIWESFYKNNGRYPYKTDCEKNKDLPSWYMVKKSCGDRFNEFKAYFKEKLQKEDFERYVKIYIEQSNKRGRFITREELDSVNEYSDILPSAKWFTENSPYTEIKTFKDFVKFCGFKYKDELTKEEVVNIILNKQKQLNRNLKKEDFEGIPYNNNDDIGIGIINKYWGTFNNMLIDLGFPINQEGMAEKHKSTIECIEDIIYICKDIYKKENRKLISYDDIDSYKDFNTAQTYAKIIRNSLGITLSDFIIGLGFKINQGSMGNVYYFEDGEVAVSNLEYKTSKYLRENNINYTRNVKYSSFVSEYEGRKDCDYVINIGDAIWYIEIAGMLYSSKSIEHAQSTNLPSVEFEYLKGIIEKESMLKEAKVNYKILFPNDLKDMESAFSFLHKNTKAS